MLKVDASNIDFVSGSKDARLGVYLRDPGNNAGYTTPVTAIFENEDTTGFEFTEEGTLVPPRAAPLRSFFSCDEILPGKERWALKFGEMELDGCAPTGCKFASIFTLPSEY
jgi:hypothetical protein